MAKLNREKIPFTQVANAVLNDAELTLKAKGLFAYLFSKPEGWNFAAERIAGEHADGKAAVKAGLQELEEKGYLERHRQPSGRVEYSLKYAREPKAENRTMAEEKPKAEKATVRKSHSAEIGLLSNKEGESNKDKENNKEGGTPTTEEFFTNKELQTKVESWLVGKGMKEEVAAQEVKKFIDYWTEPNKSNTKVRWQGEKYFDIRRRLATWFRRATQYAGQRQQAKGRAVIV